MYRLEDKIFYNLTNPELLSVLVHGEADNQIEEGKIAVMNVVRNRSTANGWFVDSPIVAKTDSIYAGVILKNAYVGRLKRFIYQFSCFQENDPNRIRLVTLIKNNRINKHYIDLSNDFFANKIADNVGGACYYYADYIPKPYWAVNMHVTTVIGRHIFLKE